MTFLNIQSQRGEVFGRSSAGGPGRRTRKRQKRTATSTTTSRSSIRECGKLYMKPSFILFAVLVAASSFADTATNQLPTIAEIDAEIASLANQYGAKTLWREFVPTVGRIKDLQDKFPTQEVIQVQWHVVSNMFAGCYPVDAVTNSNQVNYQGLSDAIWLHLTKYKLFHVDTNVLMYVADSVSNALPVDVSREDAVVQVGMSEVYMPEFGSTNALTGEHVVLDYHPRTNRVRLWWQWEGLRRMKLGFNSAQASFRRRVFNSFCELMLHDLSEYPGPERRSLWEEFCRRAGASNKEKVEAHRYLYDDFKIVYP